MAESRVEDLLETGVEQPVLPMSEIEAILRGEHITPHSRIAELLLQYNPSDILIEKRITENGTYFATNDNADGYYKVVVDEYVPRLILKQVTANGTYDPSDDDADGYSSIRVNLPLEHQIGEVFNQNGLYHVTPSQGYEGISRADIMVQVNPVLETKTIDDNGTYTPSQGYDGFSSVTVAVPKGSNANITLHCQGLGGGTVTITATNSGQTYTHTNSIATDDEDTTFSNLEYVGNWTVTNSKDSSTLTVNNSAVEADLKLLTPSIPKMISATLPKGEVSCSSSLDSNTYALFAVDKHMSDTGSQYYGNPNIGWQGNDSAPWIKYEFDEPVFFNKLYFRLHSRWDSSWATNRSYTWMVEGSNDDITYETVLANGDDTVTQNKSYNYWWIFDLALNGKKYKYLRLSTNHTMYSRDYWNENMLDLQLYSDPNAVEPITPADIHIRCLGVDGGTVTITATDGSTTYTHTKSVTLADETVIFDNLEYAGNWTITNSKDGTTATVNNAFTEGNITLMVTKIPLMTSATTPYGECISSSNNRGQDYWRYLPFDGQNGSINNDGADAWTNQRGDNSPWIGYHFMDSQGNPIKVKMDKVWVQGFCVIWGYYATRTLYFEGSNDGTNWETIGPGKVFDFGFNTRQSFEHELNGGKYEYFRIRFDASLNVVDSRWIFIERIQVYANDFAPLPTGALTATENGTYDPEDYDLSAFSEVTVNVPNSLKGALERTVSVIDDSTLESIGPFAFDGYTKLNGSSENLTSVNFRNATSIGRAAFNGCTSLTNVDFPKATSINENAFNNCTSLSKIDFPNLLRIGISTFQNCTSLDTLILRTSDSITNLANINAFNNTPFASNGAGGTLYVPQALISSYQSANNWSTILSYPNNQIKPIEGSIYE